jgi:hypothetical protein
VAYFYAAEELRSRGALWPSFAPALILHRQQTMDGRASAELRLKTTP